MPCPSHSYRILPQNILTLFYNSTYNFLLDEIQCRYTRDTTEIGLSRVECRAKERQCRRRPRVARPVERRWVLGRRLCEQAVAVGFRGGAGTIEIGEPVTPAGPTGAFRSLYLLLRV